jgi:hypothetical protein
VCWNCNGTGHCHDQCPSSKTEDSSKPAPKGKDTPCLAPKLKASESVNALTEGKEDGVWTACLDSDLFDADDEIPALQDVSDSDESKSSDSNEYWLFMVEDVSETLSDVDWSNSSSFIKVNPSVSSCRVTVEEISDKDAPSSFAADTGLDAFTLLDLAVLTHSDPVVPTKIIELYDSGMTHHLSPYRGLFSTFCNIPPKPINAANKQKFNAAGVGEMLIEVLNGMNMSKMRLTKVLYSPEISFTLISIGCIDDAGYLLIFRHGLCEIHDPDGNIVGAFPKTHGLYRVVHESVKEQANAANKKVTIMELHCLMGHIAPAAAKRLIEKGFVAGVSLDMATSKSAFYELCVYAKTKHQPVPKV